MQAPSSPSVRDPRVDVLRGLSLLSIFVDHIPKNRLADVTLHNFGFCDAAELFVILAGFSATSAYARIFEKAGLRVGIMKVLSRCLQIYGVQLVLLLCTWVFVSAWERSYGMESVILGPMLRDGWQGAMRGVTLRALPANLDILPLYIVLLALFPLVRFGMARSALLTVGASALVYAGANVFHWNLRNVVDPAEAVHWYFDPFTWQLVFVLGCWFATATRAGLPIVVAPPRLLIALCWIYAVGAFLVLDAWRLWPAPLVPDLTGTSPALSIFGNEPKTYVSPWRLLNVMAWIYLALTSTRMTALSRSRIVKPIVDCGRHSLHVFAIGCILSLLGRLTFRSYDVTVLTQVLVNVTGFAGMISTGMLLERRRTTGKAVRAYGEGRADAANAAE